MLIGRGNFFRHRPWCFGVIALALAACGWYATVARTSIGLPGGSSVVGLTLGIAGGLIILFEFLLWPRKKVRAWRIGSAQTWLRAHIWLGLLSLPLIVLHSGFVMGSPLSSVLLVLFLVVIASGVYGLVLQNILPQTILEEIPAETIYAQIEAVAGQQARDAEEMIAALCDTDVHRTEGPGPGTDEEIGGLMRRFRQVGKVRGTVLESGRVAGPLVDGTVLRNEFHDVINPFLLAGRKSRSPLANPIYARQFFVNLRGNVESEAGDAVDVLESLCEQRRQFDRQASMHVWLHVWLWVHLPLSIALVVLMFVHIFVALKYI